MKSVKNELKKIDIFNYNHLYILLLVTTKKMSNLQPGPKSSHTLTMELYTAAENGQYNVCRSILNKNYYIGYERNALKMAAKNGHFDVCRLLLNKINSSTITLTVDVSPLELATINGHFKVCRLLLRLDRNSNIDKIRALEFAVQNKKLNFCYLLSEGFDLSETHGNDSTPLTIASEYGYLDFCSFLIDRGSFVNYIKKNKITPLILAATNGHIDICKLLLHNHAIVDNEFNYCTTLIEATKSGMIDICRLLLENGADINRMDISSLPLITAIQYKHVNIFHLFLIHGADINKTDSRGSNAFIHASSRNLFDVCQTLLDNHVDPNLKNQKGDTALHVACRFKLLDMAIWLTEQMSLEAIYSLNKCDKSVLDVWGVEEFQYVINIVDDENKAILQARLESLEMDLK